MLLCDAADMHRSTGPSYTEGSHVRLRRVYEIRGRGLTGCELPDERRCERVAQWEAMIGARCSMKRLVGRQGEQREYCVNGGSVSMIFA